MSKPTDPWKYSSKEGYVTEDGKVRIYGFSDEQVEELHQASPCGKGPVVVDLEPGRYSWCTCGHSQRQPFCDSAHRDAGTNRKSYKFEVLEAGTFELCMCKQTGNPPFCDGSHEQLQGCEDGEAG